MELEGGDACFNAAIKAMCNGKRLDRIHIEFYRDDKNIREQEGARGSKSEQNARDVDARRSSSRVCGVRYLVDFGFS